jgi:hypothetical protein
MFGDLTKQNGNSQQDSANRGKLVSARRFRSPIAFFSVSFIANCFVCREYALALLSLSPAVALGVVYP